jgi:hypothetical protein
MGQNQIRKLLDCFRTKLTNNVFSLSLLPHVTLVLLSILGLLVYRGDQ